MSLNLREKRLLDAVEQLEMRSLTWGYVDGSLSRDEIANLVRSQFPTCDAATAVDDAEQLLEALIEERLLFERKGRLRSRFAETVRLATKTRQIFRKDQWRAAPRLVADFRVDRRPRLFPVRGVAPNAAWAEIAAATNVDEFMGAVWQALTTNSNGEPVTLARFQTDSAKHLLATSTDDSATIVTAGTGSGKTFCFYLPVLVQLASFVAHGAKQTLALAIYPRIELLKDQLREALSLAERIRPVLTANGVPPLRVGVLFSQTPNRATDLGGEYTRAWRRFASGYVCPFLRCPSCERDLLWDDTDRNVGKERLQCAGLSCKPVEDVVLTRESLSKSGCDLLFITTEMLNSRMTDGSLRAPLGLAANDEKRCLYVLLDEVHSYAGMTGAQVALTLRRWRNAVGNQRPVRWVGLSATLRDPEAFFSTVTGAKNISVVTPSTDELEEDGCEYQLVLRGDPSGQTSLLSTTIQTTMLIGRMADTADQPSRGTVGRKVFVFTDDLDVVNRLYHNLADAEAYRVRRNRLYENNRKPLASFRGDGDDALERDSDGQRWWAPEKIGHDLDRRLSLGRTTSQDYGVDAKATVLVATASLEVGFNDTSVGFVVQHKAPRSPTGFLQRKGRAGRNREMRPWMITVLSDYGRDRATFQSFEQLFDPTLVATDLPIDNLHVLRIQATYALLEWLYRRWRNKPSFAYLWRVAQRPGADARWREDLAKALFGLLRDDDVRNELQTYLTYALRIDEERVKAIFWQPPRGLMLEVVPTLIRRLYCDWRPAFGEAPIEVRSYGRPLPEFLPPNLFSELQLPETQILADGGEGEGMAVPTALNLLVPGRVTRRFAPYDDNVSHWIPIDSASHTASVELRPVVTAFERIDVENQSLVLLRPRTICLQRVPADIRETSNAQWEWTSRLIPGAAPVVLPSPHRGPWSGVVTGVEGYTYRRRSPVRVLRYALRGEATVHTRAGVETRVALDLCFDGERAGLGFEQEVDGLRIELSIPDDEALAARDLPHNVVASCRSLLFRHRVRTDAGLGEYANVFQLDWLAQAFLAAAVSAADEHGWPFRDACRGVDRRAMDDAISVLFPVAESREHLEGQRDDDDGDDEEVDGTDSAGSERKLVKALRDVLAHPKFLSVLRALAADAVDPPDDTWRAWLRSLTCETLAAAFGEAAAAVLPRNTAADTLLSDWEMEDVVPRMTLWLTEQSLGGAGVVEELVSICSQEPRKLLRAVDGVLSPSEVERAADALGILCRMVRDDEEVADLARACSEAVGHRERAGLLERLAGSLRRYGYAAGPTFGVSANARLLRPGMARETFALLAELDDYRARLQAQLGVVIDLRVFCRIASMHPDYGPRLRAELRRMRRMSVREGEDAQILGGMLWPQPAELRSGWQPWHPFRALGPTERELARVLLAPRERREVDLGDPEWRSRIADILRVDGTARLATTIADRAPLATALLSFTIEPIDIGWLQLHAAVERVELLGDRLTAVLYLREAV